MRISIPILLLTALTSVPTLAFVVPSSSRVAAASSGRTSTTVYYRDDVPPIGSAPQWDTPNDFDQFLTQCTIQSFTCLLKSLRDDHTSRWVNDFTKPVYEEKSSSSPSSTKSTSNDAAAPTTTKISLAEAAQSALLETDKVLQGGLAEQEDMEYNYDDDITAAEQPQQPQQQQEVLMMPPPGMMDHGLMNKPTLAGKKNLLNNVIAINDAFTAFSQAKLLHKPADTPRLKLEVELDDNDFQLLSSLLPPPPTIEPEPLSSLLPPPDFDGAVPPSPPAFDAGTGSSNTGVDQLYTRNRGLPPAARNNIPPIVNSGSVPPPPTPDASAAGVKKSFSPFGQKPSKSVPSSPFGGNNPFRPNIPSAVNKEDEDQSNQPPKQQIFSPFGNIPGPPAKSAGQAFPNQNSYKSNSGGFAPVPSTSPLYGGQGASADKSEAQKVAGALSQAAADSEAAAQSVMDYHGLGVLNNTLFPTWDSYFEQMLEQPKELLLIQSFIPQAPDIELDIDPASVCRRMIAVRSQIAKEFEHDLEVIANMGGLTLKSYYKMLEEIREQRAEEELQQQKDDLESLMDLDLEDAIAQNNGARSNEDVDARQSPTQDGSDKPKMQRANLLFLERGVGEGEAADLAPSPLRKGNFDLLCLLATQEAIHRVLNDPKRQARKSPEHGSNQFLQDFYITRLLSHFSGDQRYGRSDDFVEEMLNCPPRMITLGNTNDDKPPQEEDTQQQQQGEDFEGDSLTKDLTYLVDPVKVAETILNERELVALQWKQHLAEQVQEDHMTIQRMVLAKVMGEASAECKVVDSDGNDVEDGDFESCFE